MPPAFILKPKKALVGNAHTVLLAATEEQTTAEIASRRQQTARKPHWTPATLADTAGGGGAS